MGTTTREQAKILLLAWQGAHQSEQVGLALLEAVRNIHPQPRFATNHITPHWYDSDVTRLLVGLAGCCPGFIMSFSCSRKGLCLSALSVQCSFIHSAASEQTTTLVLCLFRVIDARVRG